MTFLSIVLAIAALILLAGFLLPSQVHVERQTTINAPAEAIFENIRDFHAWSAWSPWAKMDPNATLTITGTGVGQEMTWHSENASLGKGSQKIVQLEAPHQLKTKLDFGDMGYSDVSFTLEPSDNKTDHKTKVTWRLDADMRKGVPVVRQPMSTFFGFFMDSILGKTYEEGLKNLKTLVEE